MKPQITWAVVEGARINSVYLNREDARFETRELNRIMQHMDMHYHIVKVKVEEVTDGK